MHYTIACSEGSDVLANTVSLHTVSAITRVLRDLIDAGIAVYPADVATRSPYLTSHITRFGDDTRSDQPPPDFIPITAWKLPPAPSRASPRYTRSCSA